jgi:hypothetical protein
MQTYNLKNNKTLQVTQDESPYNPREDDNLSTMICFHRRYNLGDKHKYNSNDYSGWDEMEAAIIKNEKTAIILPLYLYDHSGITISTTEFSCRWDSGQIGFVYVSKEKLKTEYSVNKITQQIIEKATKVLLGEVNTYDQYISGEVYSYTLLGENGEVEDSCSGFFGCDIKTNGILDSIDAELVEG